VQEGDGVSVEGGGGLGVVEGGVGVLDDEVLRVGGAKAPEVDEERVPGFAVLVPVPEGFEGEEGGAPDEAATRFVSEFSRSKAAPMSCGARKWRRMRKVSLSAAEPWRMERADFSRYRATLLTEHVVVAFPRGRGQVVRVPAADVGELL
jgi:hypothetical protein